ncbi:FAD dependent oxidoreductase [uncultured Eubacteriales bacterium]|uniref:FAD dependent oxidoreductase n=1 Tax=uncultured Eubacteriales bacterium TaxID=172733 RepID=A0A212IW10_9FIRM|nr:FAD dependent oxidoreductase [uncultured Eubacteriales bacterium]
MYDVVVIGCGITGAAMAFELSRYRLKIAVLEKENDVATGATKANSAILHAGYDPAPGTLMARLNVRGSALAKELCAKLDVPYLQTGSLVVGFNEADEETLAALYHRGEANGVEGLDLLTGEEARTIEPLLSPAVTAALHAPSAAICSPWEYCLALAETAALGGAEIHLSTPVTAISRLPGGWRVSTPKGEFESRFVVNAAGVFADKVHDLAAPHAYSIYPSRGQYHLLDKSEGWRTNRVIFQCPNKNGKGVLVAPTVHGNLIVGPNAEAVRGENTATTKSGLDYVREMAWKSVPSVDFRADIRSFAGVRAYADGGDFIVAEAKGAPGFFDLAGICSPGLTAAPAIAEYAAEQMEKAGLVLEEKKDFLCTRKRIRFHDLSPDEKTALVKKESTYGHIICRCESITEGEILAALRGPIPPRSVDGVKRRVNAGMGRCQGGFCTPRVVALFCRELGLSPGEVTQEREGSQMLFHETKGGTDHV